MSLESREDATHLAQLMVERDTRIAAISAELRAKDMLGLECAEALQLKQLSAENAAAARDLAHWLGNQPLNPPFPPPLMKPQIRLILVRPDSPPDSPSTSVQIGGNRVTPAMLDAAEDLLHTLTTGERKLPKDLYEVVARAFSTTRDDAKGRILLAIYGGKGAPKVLPPDEPST
jgi:hypothetical protein